MARSRILSLIGICTGVSTVAMLWSALYVALPSIRQDLQATALQAQWVANIYGVLITSTLVLFGRLADKLGYRLLFIFGLTLALLSILGSAFSHNVNQLIFFQAILGLSGGILLPVSQALISHIYPPELKSSAIGTWGMVVGLAMAAGPFIGGSLVGLGSWRTLYEVCTILPLFSLLFLILFCPKPAKEGTSLPLDIWGAILLGLFIASCIIGIDELHQLGITQEIILFAIAIVCLILLLLVERRAEAPMLCPDLWSNRQFLVASSASFALLACIWGTFYLAPHLMQVNLELSPTVSGILMLGITLPMSICSRIAAKLMHQLSPRLLIVLGFTLFIVAYVLQLGFNYTTSWSYVLFTLTLIGIGWGFVWTPSTVVAISTLDASKSGLASGSLVTMQEMGGTLGLALTATLMRSFAGFTGFHHALWIVLIFSALGLLISLLLPSKKTT